MTASGDLVACEEYTTQIFGCVWLLGPLHRSISNAYACALLYLSHCYGIIDVLTAIRALIEFHPEQNSASPVAFRFRDGLVDRTFLYKVCIQNRFGWER